MRAPFTFLLVSLCCLAAPALASDWRGARKAYDEAYALVEKDRGKDADASAKLLQTLEEKTGDLVKADGPKAIEHLTEGAVASSNRSVVEDLLATLRRTSDKRGIKALLKAYKKSKGDKRLLLTSVLADVKGQGVVGELVKVLKDKDPRVVIAALKALSAQGAAAKDAAAGPVKRLLKDSSLRLRILAADTLQVVAGERPKDMPTEILDNETGLPDRFNADRVAFLIDATVPMAEEAYLDPFAPPLEEEPDDAAGDEGDAKDGEKADKDAKKGKKPRRGKKDAKKPEEKKEPDPLSPYSVAGKLVHTALERMNADNRFHLARFGRSSRVYKTGFGPAPKKLDDVDARLAGALSRDVNRSLEDALETVLALEPAPQQIYLYISGVPTARGRENADATTEAVRRLLWKRDVQLNVISLVLEPGGAPRNNTEREERERISRLFLKFTAGIAQIGGGNSTQITFARLVAKEEEKAAEEAKNEYFDGDLTKPLASRDVPKVKKALKAAFEKGDDEAAAFVEAVAANPNPTKVAPQLLSGLLGSEPSMAAAIARGISKNPSEAVREFVFKGLQKERDPAKQMLMLSAVGTAAGPKATAGLVDSLGKLAPDPLRMAWYYLADRPAPELVAVKGKLVRPAQDLIGLTAHHASKALAKANGQEAPLAQGIVTSAGKFFPARYLATGTAFILDTHRDMESHFWEPEAPAEKKDDEKGEEQKEEKKGKKKKRKKKDEKKDAKADLVPPEPVTCLEAVRREADLALQAVSKAAARANVMTTSGDTWRGTCTNLGEESTLQGAKGYVAKLRSGGKRDVWTPLRKALTDTSVEEIHLVVSGPPLRSTGAREPQELLDEVRKVNRAREVSIQIVYVLPPVAVSDKLAMARRADLLDAMNAVYVPMANDNGGRVIVRMSLFGLAEAQKKAAAAKNAKNAKK